MLACNQLEVCKQIHRETDVLIGARIAQSILDIDRVQDHQVSDDYCLLAFNEQYFDHKKANYIDYYEQRLYQCEVCDAST